MLTIGMKIKKLRELRNFTQEYMAKKLNMSTNGYGKIEREETDISYSRMQQIAEVLEVSISEIINFDDKMVFSNKFNHETSLIKDYERAFYEQEIQHLKQENHYLKEIIEIFKKKFS
ncbi:helix-turn-helix domain-containing protein [Thermoflexibacter ruber]|uniref:DNA-binding transcriptional regulator, XRE-family HTH domain n=1 Tax=Thermoflexibacter ruber TaxID=1003 RepID=A0A1I2B4P2_9BACT|nr:helix-turn-helix transcriptional regulator [Thermoflexibacter ruber]SFE50120.1 DNA-binding transcriptional regulator, XRE-family HTH domain [Thermoflexibacter ruber]